MSLRDSGLPTPCLEELPWDSAHFGLRIGRATRPNPRTPAGAVRWAADAGLDCLYLLTDAGDAATLRTAAIAGFRLVDIRVTLSVPVHATGTPARIRLAASSDIPVLSALAARSHHQSRFYADGNFSAGRCDALYATWIEQSCVNQGPGSAVFVVDIDGSPAGYVTLAIKDGVGEIGLIAVDQKHGGQGLGGALLRQSFAWLEARGISEVRVVTQGSNVPALRLYERAGFRVVSVQLWFHWWKPAGGSRLAESLNLEAFD